MTRRCPCHRAGGAQHKEYARERNTRRGRRRRRRTRIRRSCRRAAACPPPNNDRRHQNNTADLEARVSSIEALRGSGRIRRHSCAHVVPPRGLYPRKKKQPQSVNVSCDEILRMFQMRVALANGASACSRDDLPHSLPGAVRCPTNAAPDRLLRSA